jgi:hypothetical protein
MPEKMNKFNLNIKAHLNEFTSSLFSCFFLAPVGIVTSEINENI